VRVDAMPEAWWVVDGQQRLTALCRTLAGRGFPDEPFALFYDLRTRRFERPRRREPHHFPLALALDEVNLHDWVDQNALALTAEDKKAAFLLSKAVRRAEIATSILVGEDEQAVRSIFRRANQSGKAMLEGEVFDAISSSVSASGERFATREVRAALSGLGFGRFEDDDELIFTTLKAIAGWDVTAPAPSIAPEDAVSLYQRTRLALERAIELLRGMCGIPRFEVLPHRYALVVCGALLDKFPGISLWDRQLLSRFLWRGFVHGTLARGSAIVRQLVEGIRASTDASSAVQRLLAAVPKARPEAWPDVETFHFRNASSKLATLALLTFAPRKMKSGTDVDLDLADPALDLFPPHKLFDDELEGTKGVANRFVHPSSGRALRLLIHMAADLRAHGDGELSGAVARFLRSHAVDPGSAAALRDDDRTEFLARRTRAVQRALVDLLEERCAFEEPDRPPIASLVITDDQVRAGKP
jgi:hypothetical protein